MSYIDVPLLLHKVLSKFLFNKKIVLSTKIDFNLQPISSSRTVVEFQFK